MRALLAYLALEPYEHSREALAELFWPESDLETGRGNLRRTLSELRRFLPQGDEGWLAVSRSSLRFVATTVVDAYALLPSGAWRSASASLTLPEIMQRAACYRGELLAGLSFPESPAFEEWLQVQRETLHRSALAMLELASTLSEQAGDVHTALLLAQRLVTLEPWDEGSYCRVMRLHASNGQRSAALAVYDTCRETLKRELGVIPAEATRRLAERIRAKIDTAISEVPTPSPSQALPLQAQRRQVSVLYCEISARAAGNELEAIEDPDEAAEHLGPAQRACAELVAGLGGHVLQTHGGCFLAYFGYPQAQENAARLAVRGALAVVRTASAAVEIRASVHTGVIVTRPDFAAPDTLGRTSRIAICLRHHAAAGEVVMSEKTHALVAGYFQTIARGAQALPGLTPELRIDVHRVLQESEARTRLEVAARLTPFVGRHAELARLRACWQQTLGGTFQAMLLRGEPGLGKSRLVHALRHSQGDMPTFELRCFAEFAQSPFQPLIAGLESALACARDDPPAVRSERLRAYFAKALPEQPAGDVALLARLLGLPEGEDLNARLSPQKIKEKTEALLLRWLQALACDGPCLIVAEDLHWCDPSSLALLEALLASQQTREARPLFVLLTARPEFLPPWPADRCALQELRPLPAEDVLAMIAALQSAAETALTATLRARIVARADGVPLFVEELLKAAEDAALPGVPASLHDLLMARIDALGSWRQLAQLAACLGREFASDVLQQVAGLPVPALQIGLDALARAGLAERRGHQVWQFRHALIQDAAYASQTRQDRQRAHGRVAQALRAFPALLEQQPELMAWHLAAAGECADAIRWWITAGQRAAGSAAVREAGEHFRAALALLGELSPIELRNACEFAIWTHYSPVLYAAHGYGSEAAQHATARIASLVTLVGDSPELFFGKWAFVMNTIGGGAAPEGGALQAALQLVRDTAGDADLVRRQAAYHAAANAAFWLGEFALSREQAELGIALFQPEHRPQLLQQCGTDLSIFSRSYLACSLFFLGDEARARSVCEEKLASARATKHPHTQAQAGSFAATLYRWMRDPERVLPLAEEVIALSQDHDFPLWFACGQMSHGWALAHLGQPELGLAKLRGALQGMRATLCGIPMVFVSSLVEALMHLHQFDEALSLLEEAQAESARAGDGRLYRAELWRMQGECLLACSSDRLAQAQGCFEQALAISRAQGSRTLEARARASLDRARRVGVSRVVA
jgi:DNA-binding SARP family transcriptional activator